MPAEISIRRIATERRTGGTLNNESRSMILSRKADGFFCNSLIVSGVNVRLMVLPYLLHCVLLAFSQCALLLVWRVFGGQICLHRIGRFFVRADYS